MRPMLQRSGQWEEKYQRLESVTRRCASVVGEVRLPTACLMMSMETPSNPGALDGEDSMSKRSERVNGEVNGSQIFLLMFFSLGVCALVNHVGGCLGGVVGARSNFDASFSRVW